MVIDMCDIKIIKDMYMDYVYIIEEVLNKVYKLKGNDVKVVVILDGVFVVVSE